MSPHRRGILASICAIWTARWPDVFQPCAFMHALVHGSPFMAASCFLAQVVHVPRSLLAVLDQLALPLR
eukprot:4636099-Prymnesium_polylepis.1